jgi:Dihydrodipicolinate synthetase family
MYSLTPSEYREVVKVVVEEADGQFPVISGTGFSRQMATDLAQQSAKLGTDAILALPPYYPNSDDEGLIEYYAAIGAATQLPLFVYSRDWLNPSAAWVEKLAARPPTLRVERWAGRHSSLSADYESCRKAPALDRRRWGRLRSRLLQHRHSHLYFQHRHGSAQTIAHAARGRISSRLAYTRAVDGRLCGPVVRIACSAERLRSFCNEGNDGPAWDGRRSRSTSPSATHAGRQGRCPAIVEEMEPGSGLIRPNDDDTNVIDLRSLFENL